MPDPVTYLLICRHFTEINTHMSMKYITEQERPCQVLYGAIFEKRLLSLEIRSIRWPAKLTRSDLKIDTGHDQE
jgi:hypothetical protein